MDYCGDKMRICQDLYRACQLFGLRQNFHNKIGNAGK